MFNLDLIGYIAGALGISSLLPQLIRSWRTKSTEDLSLWRCILYSTGLVLWISYGIAIQSNPLIIVNAVAFIISLSIIYLVVKYN